MNCVWEVARQADQCGINREKLRFVNAEAPSPYLEVNGEDLNPRELYETEIPVNPLYRFHAVFQKMYSFEFRGHEQIRDLLLDITMHYIVQIDLRSGMDKRSYYEKLLYTDFWEGVFGEREKKELQLFSDGQQRRVLKFLIELYQSQNYMQVFRRILKIIYPHSILYTSQDRANEVLLYIGVKRDSAEEQKVSFLTGTFLPFYTRIHLFWNHHFGIIGVDETLEIDQTILY